MIYKVTRKAILIGCPGAGKDLLRGVEYDLKNMRSLLRSDKCGRWNDDEIITLPNPTRHELFLHIQSTYADYVFIYFSGHGWTSNTGKRMLALKDCSISDLELLNRSPRQLVVADACRKYITPGIGGFSDFGDRFENFSGTYESREIFNHYIANSPHGKIIVHATQNNEFSYDSDNGGCFTQALINIATRLKTEQNYAPVPIANILRHVPSYLQKENNFQIPAITYKTGNLKVPFAFGFKKVIRRVPRAIPQRRLTTSNSISLGHGVAFLGLTALLLIAANSK